MWRHPERYGDGRLKGGIRALDWNGENDERPGKEGLADKTGRAKPSLPGFHLLSRAIDRTAVVTALYPSARKFKHFDQCLVHPIRHIRLGLSFIQDNRLTQCIDHDPAIITAGYVLFNLRA